jgi:hypothetical protein
VSSDHNAPPRFCRNAAFEAGRHAEVAAWVSTIDGLRGRLAMAVFFHQAAIWHQYLIIGEWLRPPSSFFGNLGQAGVRMFFM